MSNTQMSFGFPHRARRRPNAWAQRLVLATLIFSVVAIAPADALAQRNKTKTFPVRPDVRLELKNRSGTVTVEGWNQNKIEITASMESSAAHFAPSASNDAVEIDMMSTNARGDVGDVNFRIRVPVNSTVDIQTLRGNITVRGVQGAMVRAHVTSEGDVELTDIRAKRVMAENMMGNITFVGQLTESGFYKFESTQGDIRIRIPADSGFRLMALSRSIDLGGFAQMFNGNNNNQRRMIGNVGNGAAEINATSLRGSLSFIR